MVSVLIDCQPSLWIKCQSVRTGLAVLSDISAFVPAFLTKHRKLPTSLGRIFVDRVAVRVAEEQITAFAIPHWAFGEFETFGEFENLRVRRNDRVDGRIFANYFDVYFARRNRDRHDAALIKLKLRLAHPDVVGRRV